MESYKFKGVCSLEGDYFLNILDKDRTTLEIRDMVISMIKFEEYIEISSIFKANNDVNAHSNFMEVIDILKSIIVFSTRRTPVFNKVNIYNLDKSEGYTCVKGCVTIISSNQLISFNYILDNMDIINQSTHLDNALHYYRLANLTDDNKDAILNLYKCVESIIGFPKGNDKIFKASLSKLGLSDEMVNFKDLRTLRNKFDAGHSAGGKESGNNSYRDVIISNKEVDDGKDIIQELIKSTIDYLTLGKSIVDIFIPDKKVVTKFEG